MVDLSYNYSCYYVIIVGYDLHIKPIHLYYLITLLT